MANFDTRGFEGLELSLEELADIPEDVLQEMLEVKGEVIADAQRKKIREMFPNGSGTLAGSITVFKKMRSAGSIFDTGGGFTGTKGVVRYILVYPAGKHGEYRRKEKTKVYKNSKHGRTYTVGGDVKDVSNNDVGFVQEFGAPRKGIVPKQWMRAANEECVDEAVAAAAKVYGAWLDSMDL